MLSVHTTTTTKRPDVRMYGPWQMSVLKPSIQSMQGLSISKLDLCVQLPLKKALSVGFSTGVIMRKVGFSDSSV